MKLREANVILNFPETQAGRQCARPKEEAVKPSKYRGVSWNKQSKRWQVRIHANGKQKHLGYFEDETEAAEAYNRAAVKLQEVRPILNFRSSSYRGVG